MLVRFVIKWIFSSQFQMPELPLTRKFKCVWTKVNKMVDGFHISTHKREICKTELHPDKCKAAYPESKPNIVVVEHLFAWLSRYKNQICCFDKRCQLFMVHRLSAWWNSSTCAMKIMQTFATKSLETAITVPAKWGMLVYGRKDQFFAPFSSWCLSLSATNFKGT